MIFPLIQPASTRESTELPLAREVAWDFENKQPIFRKGKPVIVEGKEAIRVWIWKALHTRRGKYPLYSWNYGNQIPELYGQNYIEETKRAEAIRYFRECLQPNLYVVEINNIVVTFHGTVLNIQADVKTVYGEVTIDV